MTPCIYPGVPEVVRDLRRPIAWGMIRRSESAGNDLSEDFLPSDKLIGKEFERLRSASALSGSRPISVHNEDRDMTISLQA